MGAGKPPVGDRIDPTPVKDVYVDSSTTIETETEPEAKAEAQAIEDSLNEDDLKELEEKPIPYARFREVNEKAKSAAKAKEALEKNFQDELKRISTQYEAKLLAAQQAKSERDYSIEYEDEGDKAYNELASAYKKLESKVQSMETNYTKQTQSSELARLQNKYPKADKLAVQGWKLVYPEASLDELMEKSHVDNNNMVKRSLNDLLEKKKARSKKAIPVGTSKIRLKEEERPKSFREATAMAKRYFNS